MNLKRSRWVPIFCLAVVVLVSLACHLPSTSRGAETSTPTKTETPMLLCTPPACAADEQYFCRGQCPGGCGTTCVTHTPLPPESALCPILATRTPNPSLPTRAANPPSTQRVDPHVELCASQVFLRPGGSFTLEATAVDIGLPYFTLHAQDYGASDFNVDVEVTTGGKLNLRRNNSAVIEFVQAQVSHNQVHFTLRASATGSATLWVTATGEIHYGYPGPATWAGGGSRQIVIQVNP